MLRLTYPRAEDLPAIEEYRREVLAGDGDFDGTAGLGNAPSASDWLAGLKVLSSPDAPRRGFFRTFVYLGYDGDRLCGTYRVSRPAVGEAPGIRAGASSPGGGAVSGTRDRLAARMRPRGQRGLDSDRVIRRIRPRR